MESGQNRKAVDRYGFQGLPIKVEFKAGSVRKGVSKDGKPWERQMFADYGEIEGGTLGTDGDPVDVYVGPNRKSPYVHVIDQMNPDTGEFDEQKVMMGCDHPQHATELYLQHMPNSRFFGGVREYTMDEFKRKLQTHRGQMIESPLRFSLRLLNEMALRESDDEGQVLTLGDLAHVKVGLPDAHFYIVRRGTPKRVGEPHKDFNPESIGVRVKDEHLDKILPDYLYYVMMHQHSRGVWEQLATGSTSLVNIRASDVRQLPFRFGGK